MTCQPPNPLNELAARAADDVKTLFADDVVQAAHMLRIESPGEFEALRRELKAHRVGVTAWIKRLDEHAKSEQNRIKQEQQAIERARAEARQDRERDTVQDLDTRPADDHEREGFGYKMTPGAIYDTDEKAQIAGFSAVIAEHLIETDGVTETHSYRINLNIGGETRWCTVLADDYVKMGWVSSLGPRAVLFAGHIVREKARAAIQLLSGKPQVKRVYTFTGWTKINSAPVYLHGGGGIGATGPIDGVEVHLPQDLQGFTLKTKVSEKGLRKAARLCMDLLELQPADVAIPLFATVWRSLLGPSKLSLYIAGAPNTGKTVLSALAQQHVAPSHDENAPPATWADTALSLASVRSTIGDAPFLIDDFVPTGTVRDQELSAKADAVIRGQFSGSGRRRMNRDGQLISAKPARSTPIITGEALANGHSMRTRCVVLYLHQRVNKDLTIYKEFGKRGAFSAVAADFVQWVAHQRAVEDLDKHNAQTFEGVKRSIAEKGVTDRTAHLLAEIAVGLNSFVRYAEETHGIKSNVWRDGVNALTNIASRQIEAQQAQDPVKQFLDCLSASISSGACHVLNDDGETPPDPPTIWGWKPAGEKNVHYENGESERKTEYRPSGQCVGWTDSKQIYVWLLPNTALSVAKKAAIESGSPLPILSVEDLLRRLDDGMWLASKDAQRRTRTVRKTVKRLIKSTIKLEVRRFLVCADDDSSDID